MAKLNIRNRNKNKTDKAGKPKSANWEYQFEAAKIDGKRKSISKAGFKTKKEVEIAGTKAMADYNNAGLKFEPSDMSYSDYLDYWFDNYVQMSCKYNTQLAYTQIIENHLKPSLGKYKLRSLTPIIIQDYVNQKFVTGLKKTTLTNIMAVLSGSFKYAVVPAQLLQSSPAEYVKYPKIKSERTEVNRTIISVEDFNKMLERFEKGNTIYRLIEVEKTVPVALPPANLIMRKENGHYSSTDSFKYAARVIHYDLGIKFNFHSLRHTHATN